MSVLSFANDSGKRGNAKYMGDLLFLLNDLLVSVKLDSTWSP